MASPKKDPRHDIAYAALRLAATLPWTAVTHDRLAKATGVPLAKIRQLFATPHEILTYLVAANDAKALSAFAATGETTPLHDRLFDALMARFDALQPDRAAFLQIIAASKRDPHLAALLGRAMFSGMKQLAARTSPRTDIALQLTAAGLTAVYFGALCSWQRDTTPDLAGTMAALDRHLRRSGKVAAVIFRAI